MHKPFQSQKNHHRDVYFPLWLVATAPASSPAPIRCAALQVTEGQGVKACEDLGKVGRPCRRAAQPPIVPSEGEPAE